MRFLQESRQLPNHSMPTFSREIRPLGFVKNVSDGSALAEKEASYIWPLVFESQVECQEGAVMDQLSVGAPD